MAAGKEDTRERRYAGVPKRTRIREQGKCQSHGAMDKVDSDDDVERLLGDSNQGRGGVLCHDPDDARPPGACKFESSDARYEKSKEASENSEEVDLAGEVISLSVYPRMMAILSVADGLRPTLRNFCWVVKKIDELYDARRRAEQASFAAEGDFLNLDVGVRRHPPFPAFAYQHFKNRHGIKRMVRSACLDLVSNVHIYRRQHPEVEVFARFLEEYYGQKELLFFLDMRVEAHRVTRVCTRRRVAMKTVWMTLPDCVRVAKGVFEDTATLYFRDLIATVESQMEGHLPKGSPPNLDTRRISLSHFLYLAIVCFVSPKDPNDPLERQRVVSGTGHRVHRGDGCGIDGGSQNRARPVQRRTRDNRETLLPRFVQGRPFDDSIEHGSPEWRRITGHTSECYDGGSGGSHILTPNQDDLNCFSGGRGHRPEEATMLGLVSKVGQSSPFKKAQSCRRQLSLDPDNVGSFASQGLRSPQLGREDWALSEMAEHAPLVKLAKWASQTAPALTTPQAGPEAAPRHRNHPPPSQTHSSYGIRPDDSATPVKSPVRQFYSDGAQEKMALDLPGQLSLQSPPSAYQKSFHQEKHDPDQSPCQGERTGGVMSGGIRSGSPRSSGMRVHDLLLDAGKGEASENEVERGRLNPQDAWSAFSPASTELTDESHTQMDHSKNNAENREVAAIMEASDGGGGEALCGPIDQVTGGNRMSSPDLEWKCGGNFSVTTYASADDRGGGGCSADKIRDPYGRNVHSTGGEGEARGRAEKREDLMWNVSENYLPAKHAAIFQSVPSPSPSSSHSAVRISAIAKRPTQNCSLNSRLASESIDRVLQNRKGEPSPTCLPHDCDVVGTGSGDTRGPRDGYMGEEGRPAEALKDRRPVEESRFSRNFKDDSSDDSAGLEIRTDVLSIATEWFASFERRFLPCLAEEAAAGRGGTARGDSRGRPGKRNEFLPSAIARVLSEEMVRVLALHRRDLHAIARHSPDLLRDAVAKAFWMLEDALSTSNKHLHALCNMGRLLEDRGNPDEGLACFQEASAVDTENPEPLCLWATNLQQKEMFDGAAFYFTAALSRDDSYGSAWYGLGQVKAEQGKHADAAEAFTRWLDGKDSDEVVGENGGASQAKGLTHLGDAYRGLGQDDEAQRSYERAISIDEYCSEAHFKLGSILQGRGGHDAEALKSFERAMNSAAGAAASHDRDGSCPQSR